MGIEQGISADVKRGRHHGCDDAGAGQDCRRGRSLRRDGVGADSRRYPGSRGRVKDERPEDDKGHPRGSVHPGDGKVQDWAFCRGPGIRGH